MTSTSKPPWPPNVESYDYSLFGEVEKRPLNSIRKVIGRRLSASWTHVPHVAQFDEVDLAALEALRSRVNAEATARGPKLTLLPFILKASALALKEHPEVNSSLDDGAENLVLKKYVHIGFATDTRLGLLVPVIKDVDRKTLVELGGAIASLKEKARAGRLALSDVEGGCFTVSNLGQLGGTGFTPTISAPEVAILGVARAGPKVVELDGRFVSRPTLPIVLVYDHRAIDGALAGRFVQCLRRHLTEPAHLWP